MSYYFNGPDDSAATTDISYSVDSYEPKNSVGNLLYCGTGALESK